MCVWRSCPFQETTGSQIDWRAKVMLNHKFPSECTVFELGKCAYSVWKGSCWLREFLLRCEH